jgi:Predicted membrane protein
MHHYQDAIARYFDFSGRASRTQFWMYTLITFIGAIAMIVLDSVLFGFAPDSDAGFLIYIFQLFHLIPGLAIAARRLHDIGNSGWWLLLLFVPIVGAIAIFVMLVLPTSPNGDRYGAPGPRPRVDPPANAPSNPQPGNDWARPPETANVNLDKAGTSANDRRIGELERLRDLHKSGAIDDTEYADMKRAILNT